MQVPHVPQSHTSSVAQLANACIALRTSLLQRREIVAEQQFFIAHVEVEPMLQVDHGHMALQAVDHPRPRDVQPLPQQVVPAAVVVQGHHGHAQRPTARVRQCQARHQQRALQAFAHTVRHTVRGGDVLARWGGEEFVLLLGDVNDNAALSLLQRIGQAVSQAVVADAPEGLRMTVSTGLTVHLPGESVEATLERADQALYRAKEGGRNRTAT